MSGRSKPPAGVTSWAEWAAYHWEPTLSELLHRYMEVDAAVIRFRAAGERPRNSWLMELMGWWWYDNRGPGRR